MNRAMIFGLICVATSAGFCGCGAAPTGTTGDGPTGHAPGEVSDDARQATLDAAAQLLTDASNPDIDALLDDIRNQLASRADVISAGVYGDSVWVQFADGQVLVVVGNRDQLDPNFTDKGILHDQNAKTILPVPPKARLMNALGTVFHSALDQVKPWLVAAGYNVAIGDSSVEGLKSVGGDGLFYFDTHGAPMPAGLVDDAAPTGPPATAFTPPAAPDESQDHFVLWTSTNVTADTLGIYRDELRAGNLVTIVAVHDRSTITGKATVAQHFGITEKFISKYKWGFGDGSVVFINACYSNNQLLKNACFAAGAHLFGGWTRSVRDDDSLAAGLYYFDRTLGANSAYKVSPAQRPFQAMDVFAQMKNAIKTWNNLPMSESPTRGIKVGAAVSELIFSPASNEDAELRPGIEGLTVDEAKDQVQIFGTFGETRGSVKMDGTTLPVVTWDNSQIVCSIPRSGAGSAGDCIVTSGGHGSNARRLTAWSGHARWTRNYLGSTFFKLDWNVRFRADVAKLRLAVDGPTFGRTLVVHPTKDATIEYSAGGSYDNGGGDIHSFVTNPGIDVPYQLPNANPLGTDFDFTVSLDGVANTLSFGGNGYIPGGYSDVGTTNPTPSPQSLIGNGGSGAHTFPNGSNYDIPAGSVTTPQPVGNRVFDWDAMPAQFPPDPTAPL